MCSKYDLDKLIIGKYLIDDIFLLSKEEYRKYKSLIPILDDWWWLRSPGYISYSAAVVNGVGSVRSNGYYVALCSGVARPVLRIPNLKFLDIKPGDILIIFGREWVLLDKDLVIAKKEIRKHRFDKELNNYETSEIKQYLQNWLKKQRKKYNK